VLTTASRTYCFGDFRFDSLRRLLFQGPVVTPLPERLALLLTHLLQASGAVVSKEALALSVWPQEAVSDGNLAQHIYLLRRLLGDRARDHSYILSVQGRGYRFAAPVAIANPALSELFTVDAASLGKVLTESAFKCFRSFCRGSFFLEQRTAPHIRRAIEFFETALLMNPDYVPALIGLARAHSLLGCYWHAPSNLSFPPAKRAISRALEIDPGSASAHAVVSGILCFADWDWNGAKDAIEIALRLDPGSTFVRNNAAWLHVCTGNYAEALAQAQFALTMDPSSLPLQLLLARVLVHSTDYCNAIDMMSNLLEADSAFYIARRYRAQAYLLSGEPDKALADLQLLPEERSEDPSFRLPMLGRAYAELGDCIRAQKILETLQWLAQTDYVAFWNLAIVASALGRLDDALSYLETAYEQREATLPFLKSLPWFESIAAAPRFKSLLSRVGPCA
jgi:DNA-binding winged helix-turn-helix (wHTH) protein/Flp pilus assembly protein TadD